MSGPEARISLCCALTRNSVYFSGSANNIMVLIFSVFLGGVILALTHAIYQSDCVLLAAGLFLICFLAGRDKPEALLLSPNDSLERNSLLVVAVLFAVLLSQDHELLYANVTWGLNSLRGFTFAAGLLALTAALAAVFCPRASCRRWVKVAIGTAAACLIAARFMVPIASPAPFIDVFWINTWAVNDFLQGKNPYSQIYPDIYKGHYGYQPGFTYWPSYLLAASVPGAFHLDLRFLNVLSDLSFAGILAWFSTRSKSTVEMAWPLALLWLAMPVSLFIIEQAWIDPFMLVLASGSILAFRFRQLNLAALLGGLAMASKQYGFIVPSLLTIGIFASMGWKPALRFCLIVGGTLTLLVAPFLIWDFAGFYKNTVQILMVIPMRLDSLTIPAFFVNSFGYEIPGIFLLVSYVAVFLGCLWKVWRLPKVSSICFAATFCYGFLFLMGKQASANYYAIVVGLALVALIEGIQEKDLDREF